MPLFNATYMMALYCTALRYLAADAPSVWRVSDRCTHQLPGPHSAASLASATRAAWAAYHDPTPNITMLVLQLNVRYSPPTSPLEPLTVKHLKPLWLNGALCHEGLPFSVHDVEIMRPFLDATWPALDGHYVALWHREWHRYGRCTNATTFNYFTYAICTLIDATVKYPPPTETNFCYAYPSLDDIPCPTPAIKA